MNVDLKAVEKFAEQMENLDALANTVVKWMEDNHISPLDKLFILCTVDKIVRRKWKEDKYKTYYEKVEEYEGQLHMAVVMGI